MRKVNFAQTLALRVDRLAFLRASLHIVFAWLLACVVLITLLWVRVHARLDMEHEALREHSYREATSFSKTYARQLARSLEQINQITLTLKYYWQDTHGTLKLEKQLQQGLYPSFNPLHVSIVDADGMLVTSTLDISSKSISDRDYFQLHKNNPASGLIISKPVVGIRLEKVVTLFSRRLDKPDGAFAGAIIVAAETAYLASFNDEFALRKSDFFSVMDKDGTSFASQIGKNNNTLRTVFSTLPEFPASEGVLRMPAEKFVDGQPRVIAWQKLDNYPFISVVGLSEQEILASYQATKKLYYRLGIAGTVFFILFAGIGVYLCARLAWRKQREEEVKNTYHLAIDGAREGFYMLRTMYGRQHEIEDFFIEDCNGRGAALVGSSKEELIGSRLLQNYSGTFAQQVLSIFRKAMETGFHEDVFRVSPDSQICAKWIHRRLVRSGTGLAMTLRDISEAKEQEQLLSDLANMDALTSLPNRYWLMNFLPLAIQRVKDNGSQLALLFVDLDDFKVVNDTMGHLAGDLLLQAAALRLKSLIRASDHVVRLGGDEFTVVLEQINTTEDASHISQLIISAMSEPFALTDGHVHQVHASIGISMFPRDGEDAGMLLQHADQAMYAAKKNGKGRYRFYEAQLA
ncbi:bifunctional diguanylate cyclase/phosphodiesterase [Undibacterium sp.]|jgi:diguanylate cyclase (GGDEF)-like protein|uniref:bifunctional diguanylate cyclase/phosphodiesterase n=1 Tax=Undibacterium sp. TaxID=1914977 RepID=UPI002C3CFB0E|nr:diguanylate cyclase [Undibacterium sp.]HTD04116.1 diguanylate cyclase [Undibacterium sp.]